MPPALSNERYTTSLMTAVAVTALGLGACEQRTVPDGVAPELTLLVGAQTSTDMDILFVVDNNHSMGPWQDSLRQQFPTMVERLKMSEGGLPNVHIGVVSTDMGAGSQFAGGCDQVGPGRGGYLQTIRPEHCDALNQDCRFIVDVGDQDCVAEDPLSCREVNYRSVDIEEVFGEMVQQLTVDGCMYTEPMEAMVKALDGSIPENNGFLRPNAALAVMVVSNRDDCSVYDQNLADPAATQFGAPTPFRCFEYGVVCEPDDPRTPGDKSNCQPRNQEPRYLQDTQQYAEFLRSLKPDPSIPVILAVIAAPPEPVVVEPDRDMPAVPALGASCMVQYTDQMGNLQTALGHPAVRLSSVVEDMGMAGAFISLCDPNLSATLEDIANDLGSRLQGTCLTGDLYDTDPATEIIEPRCDVVESDARGSTPTEIESCDESAPPCYYVVENQERCTDSDHHLALVVDRDSIPYPGTVVAMACDLDKLEAGYVKTSYYGCAAAGGGQGAGWLLLALALLLGMRRRRRA